MGIGNVVARALARPAIISFLRTPIDILHSGNRHERAGIRKTQQDRLLLLLFRFSCERIHVCFFFVRPLVRSLPFHATWIFMLLLLLLLHEKFIREATVSIAVVVVMMLFVIASPRLSRPHRNAIKLTHILLAADLKNRNVFSLLTLRPAS